MTDPRGPALAGSRRSAASGCVSLKRTPEARFFVLRSVVEPPTAPAAAPRRGLRGRAAGPRCPGTSTARSSSPGRRPSELRIDEFLRWAEPLDDGVDAHARREPRGACCRSYRVAARALAARRPSPRCRVVTELRVFGLQANGEVRLDGRWALLRTRGERPLAGGSVSLARGPLASGPNGVDAGAGVDAMSDLVAELSRTIADAIRTLPDEPKDAPPGP